MTAPLVYWQSGFRVRHEPSACGPNGPSPSASAILSKAAELRDERVVKALRRALETASEDADETTPEGRVAVTAYVELVGLMAKMEREIEAQALRMVQADMAWEQRYRDRWSGRATDAAFRAMTTEDIEAALAFGGPRL